eukprot:TRINITY_DN5974_c0_g1_i1.p1 TRINITY_DN5974_c0_g1~~TRINITY_DN5974_c0_g1_i1.p1  ORF type:complete len:968 (+),score=218.00 TRINITY_DN5974_c0_g1_i1:77-2905(+)
MGVYELESRSKLSKALERVRVLLDATKSPKLASDVHHRYQDKYTLVETFTNTAAVSQLNALAEIGLTREQLAQLQQWAKTSVVSLKFEAEETCKFDREETREEEDPRKHVEEVSVGGVVQAAFTSKVVNKITEYYWKFEGKYQLLALRGVGAEPADRVCLREFSGRGELKTGNKSNPPRPEVAPKISELVDMSWLLHAIGASGTSPGFKVDRSSDKCRTPRRNPDVEKALEHFMRVGRWVSSIVSYLGNLMTIEPGVAAKLDFTTISADSVFCPVLPLMIEDNKDSAEETRGALEQPSSSSQAPSTLACVAGPTSPEDSLLLPVGDTNCLLGEEARTLKEKCNEISQVFPDAGLACSKTAVFMIALQHCGRMCTAWSEAVDYVEDMLRKQLAAAIGKEVWPADFASYMSFHNRKLFKQEYAPAPFCFAVRRSKNHSPEGTVSIEELAVGAGGDSNIEQPIVTIVAKSNAEHLMTLPISASTNVAFGGDRYLHAYLSHQFEHQAGAKLSLISKARQFSSMLVIIGRVASISSFDPKYAAIIQNKDELTIPLELSTIPTPKEFKDAIESLSPEQQAFAKAFRSMQLESTLFGVLVVQIKPQMEKVLNLAEDSLTKEIKLTQDLMQLFVKYQIPTDLLSFDGTAEGADGIEIVDPSAGDRLQAVKSHVKAMLEMIEQEKNEEVEQRKQEHLYEDPFAGKAAPPPSKGPSPPGIFKGGAKGKGGVGGGGGGGCGGMCFGMAAGAPVMKNAARCRPAAAPPQQPRQQVQQQQQQQQPLQRQPTPSRQHDETQLAGTRDYTQVPKQMDEQFEKLDRDSALRPTIIDPSKTWTKTSQKALLASPSTSVLRASEQKAEKDAAFDLLDALTKSGALPLTHASLHIVIAATHCFDRSVTETIVQDNQNPIDKVERSSLILASTIHQQPAAALINDAHHSRVSAASPQLFLTD